MKTREKKNILEITVNKIAIVCRRNYRKYIVKKCKIHTKKKKKEKKKNTIKCILAG